jgi:transcriptional regulator with XRE-family HTH domain
LLKTQLTAIYFNNNYKGGLMGGKELRAIFGKNIRIYRNRRNWSQADLAEYANISINFIGDMERGKKWPHPETLTKLADALEIRIFELFMEEENELNMETKKMMNRFIKDVYLTMNKTLSLSVNQSIEYVLKQYRLV